MEPSQSRDSAGRPSRLVKKEHVDVWAFDEHSLYRGAAHRLEGQRMSDIFNDILSPTLKGPRSRFVPLTQATVTPLGGGESRSANFLALGKNQVRFAGEVHGDSTPSSALGAAEMPSLRLAAVEITLVDGVRLSGTLCRPVGKRTLDVVNDEREFLPLRSANVTWLGGVARDFSFLIVGKAHIAQVTERDEPVP